MHDLRTANLILHLGANANIELASGMRLKTYFFGKAEDIKGGWVVSLNGALLGHIPHRGLDLDGADYWTLETLLMHLLTHNKSDLAKFNIVYTSDETIALPADLVAE